MFSVILTYVLASIFAIAGIGAAGVLIPNYIALGMSVHAAMMLGLSQNTAELTVATAMNASKKLVDWKKVAMLVAPAVLLVPVGAYINIHIPRIVVMAAFDLFLIFAVYRILFPKRSSERKAETIVIILGAVEGFIAGLIGMDAAPIALIAFSFLFDNPKKVSANTAAAALGVSATALVTYYLMLPKIPLSTTMLIAVATAGLLGGITGAFLMHRVNQKYVRYTMLGILILAFAEIFVKIILMGHMVSRALYMGSVISVLVGLAVFLAMGVGSKYVSGSKLSHSER